MVGLPSEDELPSMREVEAFQEQMAHTKQELINWAKRKARGSEEPPPSEADPKSETEKTIAKLHEKLHEKGEPDFSNPPPIYKPSMHASFEEGSEHWLHGACHLESPAWCVIYLGCVWVQCATCQKWITRLALKS